MKKAISAFLLVFFVIYFNIIDFCKSVGVLFHSKKFEENGRTTMGTTEVTITNECYSCANKRSVPGDSHIKCVKPDIGMTGNKHGIKEGWFIYPLLFDPIWKTKRCKNFELCK